MTNDEIPNDEKKPKARIARPSRERFLRRSDAAPWLPATDALPPGEDRGRRLRSCAAGTSSQGLFFAGPDLISEILLRDSVVGFTVVCTDACCGPDHLFYQSARHWIDWNLLSEGDNRLPKLCGSLLQIIRFAFFRAAGFRIRPLLPVIAPGGLLGRWSFSVSDFFRHWVLRHSSLRYRSPRLGPSALT